MDTLLRDLRDAFRQWVRTPVVTAVVLLSLALGIGANTAIYSLIDSLLLRPLPVRNPGELARITEPGFNTLGYPVWHYIDTDSSLFSSSAAVTLMRPDISPTAERHSALGLAVSGSFFDVLGVQPALGRLIGKDDDRFKVSSDVVVLEYEFWRSAYGGRNVIGETIPLDGQPFTIVGVIQQGFFGLNVGRRFDLAISLEGMRRLYPTFADSMGGSLTVFGRLRQGQSLDQVQARLRGQQAGIREALQMAANMPWLVKPLDLVSMAKGISTETQSRYGTPLRVLMGLVALVLVIACANVANLLLVRGSTRQAEMATRLSLGASRGQVIRALALECLAISLAGALLAIVIGNWVAHAIVDAITVNQATSLATWIDVSLNWRVFAFTAIAGIVTALIFGVGPAIWTTRIQPVDAMRQGARSVVSSGSRIGVTHWLVIGQVGVAFALILGGALLVRSFVNLTAQDLGFDSEKLIVAIPDFNRSSISRAERMATADRIRGELATMPGIESVGFADSTPFGFGPGKVPIDVPGITPTDGEPTSMYRISAGYFDAIGRKRLAGRDLAPFALETATTVLVNEAFAQKYFAHDDPIGRSFKIRVRGHPEMMSIAGVVRDARTMSLREPAPPELYVPFLPKIDTGWVEILMRTNLTEAAARSLMLETITRLAPGASAEFRLVQDGYRMTAARDRVVAGLAAGFAILALLLAAIGLYGVMAYHVVLRRRELGVRMAMGAAPAGVQRLVLRQAIIVVAAGLVIGAALTAGLGRLIGSLLFGVEPTDPAMIVVAIVILSAVTLLAGYLPARQAARIDPMSALREE